MADFLIYGVAADDKRTLVAHTPSARAAREYRDKGSGPWERIIVCSSKDDLSEADLDELADNESRLFKFS